MPKIPGYCSEAESGTPTSGGFEPISAAEASSALAQRSNLVASPAGVFWLEFDPESGHSQLWTTALEGPRRITPPEYSVRSRVNGYGGGALCASRDAVFVVEEQSQQIECLDGGQGLPVTLTTDYQASFGGLVVNEAFGRVLAVRECAGQQQLVAVDNRGRIEVLHRGEDFYGAPAVSSSGREIAWVSWRLPDMPWISSILWTAQFDNQGRLRNVRSSPTREKGCVQQPVFAGEQLQVLSDHQGWWQPWIHSVVDGAAHWQPLDAPAADHASAPWQLGESHHQPLGNGGGARVCYRDGVGELWLTQSEGTQARRVAMEYIDFRSLCFLESTLYCIARSSGRLDSVLAIDPESLAIRRIAGGEAPLPPDRVSMPQVFHIPPSGPVSEQVSGFYYPPLIPDREAGPPPVIIIAHGGPTSAAYAVFNPQTQFWCHHGFAVAEVNYRGSSGFGRPFRMTLADNWGVVDVEDMERALDHLAGTGLVDARRAFIQGRSAGGYTALMAMARGGAFRAGASLFGVSDPMQLRKMTHRFESGYLDWLLGDPEIHAERWIDRTPVHQAYRIRKPMMFFQGGLDRVVVPEQTHAIVNAMEAQGQTPELCWFPEEGHGFRQRSTQIAMLERLLDFYHRYSQKVDDGSGDLR